MDSLIVAVLTILIVILILVIFVPAYLEKLSRQNRLRRDELHAQLLSIERDSRRYERLLSPYLRTRSAAYLDLASQAADGLKALMESMVNQSVSLDELRCPEVFDYLLPVQHFILRPDHIGAIVTDTRRLRSLTTGMSRLIDSSTSVQAALDSLVALPEKLAAVRIDLERRLKALEATINREREEGIEALDDFLRDGASIRRFLEEAEGSARPGAILAELDGGAVALQSAESALAEAESRAGELQRERMALDRRLRRVATELDGLQVSNKSGPAATDLPQIRPLLRRAAALLNESAQEHRRRREFNAAGADVSTAAQLVNFGRDVNTTVLQVRVLIERDDGGDFSEAIADLRRDLDGLLGQLRDERADHAALGDAALASRAAQLRTRADTLIRRQDDRVALLTREAAAAREKLTATWENGQSLLRLSEDDALSRRYSRLLNQFEEAQGKPAALEQYRQDVKLFEGVWHQWVGHVQETGTRITRLRSNLLGLIDEALTTAEPWNCLAEDVTYIQQRAANFETAQAKFAAVHFRREAESIMDQLQAIDTDIEARFLQLKDRAKRLQFLESDVDQIVDLVTNDVVVLQPDDPQRAKWDRTLRIIDHHIRSAHAALLYEDASVALLRAADAANKQAL